MIFVCYKTSVMILVHGNTKSFLSRILIHSCCLNQQIDVCTVIISYVVSERFCKLELLLYIYEGSIKCQIR